MTAVFKLLDLNDSGFIEMGEGMKIGKALGYNPVLAYWQELVKLDSDGDGKISLDEFLTGHASMTAINAVDLKERVEMKLANLAAQGGTQATMRLNVEGSAMRLNKGHKGQRLKEDEAERVEARLALAATRAEEMAAREAKQAEEMAAREAKKAAAEAAKKAAEAKLFTDGSLRPEGTIELLFQDSRFGFAVAYQVACTACGFKKDAMGSGMPVGQLVKCESCNITAIAVERSGHWRE